VTLRRSLGLALVVNELAVLPRASVSASAGLGASLLLLDASGFLIGGPGSLVMWLGLAALGAAAAFTLDDASTAVTSAVPLRRASRLSARLLVPLALLGLWVTFAVVAARNHSGLSVAALGVTGAGVMLLALGMASLARTSGVAEPGTLVAPLVLLLVVVVALALPFMFPEVRLLMATEVSRRDFTVWVVLASAAVAAVGRAGSDPWRRRRHA
jgi:hypothetical protein